ncbi:unnamed protein product [Colias eurytheme]|nr:unnamed protein product [Colias eurytheme]
MAGTCHDVSGLPKGKSPGNHESQFLRDPKGATPHLKCSITDPLYNITVRAKETQEPVNLEKRLCSFWITE